MFLGLLFLTCPSRLLMASSHTPCERGDWCSNDANYITEHWKKQERGETGRMIDRVIRFPLCICRNDFVIPQYPAAHCIDLQLFPTGYSQPKGIQIKRDRTIKKDEVSGFFNHSVGIKLWKTFYPSHTPMTKFPIIWEVFYAPEQLLLLNLRISDPESEKQAILQLNYSSLDTVFNVW